MPQANLNREYLEINDGLDSIVVVQSLSEIPGGRTLDVSGLAAGVTCVRSGHVLVKDNKSKAISPLTVTDGAYASVPEGKTVCGVLKFSVSRNDPRASIVTAGQINVAASPAAVTDAIKSALPGINWLYE